MNLKNMSHTKLLYHMVFGTKDRAPLIVPDWEIDLYKYMSGIVRGIGGSTLEINSVDDHLHLLAKLPPKRALSDMIRDIKADSSSFTKRELSRRFSWSRGYGAFSVSESGTNAVRRYIRNQKEHHKKQGFEDEYRTLLKLHCVEFDDRYLWS